MKKLKLSRVAGVAALFAASAGLAACDDTREAEAETPVAEAEVETELPEAVVSEEELEQAAEGAAADVSQGASEALPAE